MRDQLNQKALKALEELKPSKDETSQHYNRYSILVRILRDLLKILKEKNIDSTDWTVCIEKINKKFLNQSFTLLQLFQNETFIIDGETQVLFYDLSSVNTLIRLQIENFSVFYHIFVDDCNVEEKQVRFKLWELEAILSRRRYNKPLFDDGNIEIIEKEKQVVDPIIAEIYSINYFKTLPEKVQKYLIEKTLWNFSNESIRGNDKRNWKISNKQLFSNTGLTGQPFDDWYPAFSIHAHTDYGSVIQNDRIMEEHKSIAEHVAISNCIILTACVINDICVVEEMALKHVNSLPNYEQDLLLKFDKRKTPIKL
jgi:hypothetical protein